jgi:ABC-2 type transport system permease protein
VDTPRWFQVISALNPVTYVSQGPVPHLPLWLCLVVTASATVVTGAVGVRGFLRRALD